LCPEQSSAAGETAGGLFTSLFTTDAVAAATSDKAWLQAMLDFESSLVRTEAGCGLVEPAVAAQIAAACRAAEFDPVALGRAGRLGGNPVIPLVAALRERVGPDAAASVHLGATSQDVLDSALMLVAKRTTELLTADLERAIGAAVGLADAHRDTLQVARTLLQQALPTTFGLRAASWANALIDAAERLEQLRARTLAVQFGGAAGTLASLGGRGAEVGGLLAAELGLALAPVPWHADRQRVVELGTALAMVSGTCGKIARDVALLMQTEIGEVSEPAAEGRGASSALPQKRNPTLSTILLANSRRAAGLIGILLGAMDNELDRSPGAWHAEWQTATDLLRAAGGSAGLASELLAGLEVDAARMRQNLESSGGLVMAERLKAALTLRLSPSQAAATVNRAAKEAAGSGVTFHDAVRTELEESGNDALAGLELGELMDPAGYLGSAAVFVDAVLERYAALRWVRRGDGPGRG
jgi:3-carboxy-cis,cis-muconate cycloisomerase